MMTFRNLICVTLMAALATGAMADEKKGKGKKRGGRKAPTATQRFVGKMDLTDAQKEQIGEIDRKFGEQFKALRQKQQSILTEEQKKTQREMMAKAKNSDKKGPELRKEMQAALKLTPEQQARQKELQKEQREFGMQVVAALKTVLTPEQQEKLPKMRAGGKGKGAAGKGKGKGKKKKAAA